MFIYSFDKLINEGTCEERASARELTEAKEGTIWLALKENSKCKIVNQEDVRIVKEWKEDKQCGWSVVTNWFVIALVTMPGLQ